MYLRWSGDSVACWSSIISCDSEMIEFSGVRSSWLSRERRLFFSRSEYSSLDSASNSPRLRCASRSSARRCTNKEAISVLLIRRSPTMMSAAIAMSRSL